MGLLPQGRWEGRGGLGVVPGQDAAEGSGLIGGVHPLAQGHWGMPKAGGGTSEEVLLAAQFLGSAGRCRYAGGLGGVLSRGCWGCVRAVA